VADIDLRPEVLGVPTPNAAVHAVRRNEQVVAAEANGVGARVRGELRAETARPRRAPRRDRARIGAGCAARCR
jgi:hypothetical protein